MHPLGYVQAREIDTAIHAAIQEATSAFIAGGTGIVDLMQDSAQLPRRLVDINPLPINTITVKTDSVRIGAMVRNSEVIANAMIRDRYPALFDALSYSATPQIRNMATVGGNLLQRTRCSYFRDVTFSCNERNPGSGCPALEGYNRSHAILGTSESCIAAHASDMAVALTALDAVIHTRGLHGERQIPITEFYLEPGETPERETVLEHGEIIVAVELPNSPLAAQSHYFKSPTDNFSLAAVAAALAVHDGVIQAARIAFGGVATKPWRSISAETVLINAPLNEATFNNAAIAALETAVPRTFNGFKVELLKRMLIYALLTVGGIA
ncbi:MAG: xanthine dehydrogenase family protein subunit M [Stenomitos rutilans HA7619-LM2]|jgi:xanthine dehydrogenase YagS FAD-binding subunit|nr:xanthine dehydrogenase family protein subunit M [Stenomitos rutilans HA7619-LM2]